MKSLFTKEEDKKKKKKLIFAIDFDGTIVSNSFPKIGEPNKKMIEFIKKIKENGDQWILYTCRDGKYLQEALDFLETLGIKPDKANEDILDFEGKSKSCKPFANIYIDDRNAGGLVIPDVYQNQNQGD